MVVIHFTLKKTIDRAVCFSELRVKAGSVGVLGSLSLLSFLLKSFLSMISGLFLLNDLLDVHVDEFVLNLRLLLAQLIFVELLAASQTFL